MSTHKITSIKTEDGSTEIECENEECGTIYFISDSFEPHKEAILEYIEYLKSFN